MKPCPKCQLPEPDHILPDGIWWDARNAPVGIAYRCACGNNRTIPWDATTEELRRIAIDIEKMRMSIGGAI